MVRSTCCSGRKHEFGSQHPHGDPQPLLVQVPGDFTSFPDFSGHQECMWCIYIHAGKQANTENKIK